MTVCVHGLGYIGLPTAAVLANAGERVLGYDASQSVRESLKNGTVHVDEPGLTGLVKREVETGNLEVVTEPESADVHVVCVPTPFDEDRKEPDLSYVEQCGETIAEILRPGDTVVLESTVPPGTTTDVFRPLLESSGLVAGEDFGLAHCPETVLPGNILTELKRNDRVIGGVDAASCDVAIALYETFVDGDLRTTDATTAEFVKLIQNTFRDTNIAFANEVAKIAAEHGIDSRTAIELANEHPRVGILNPGPGVGGHCLPVDPWFLVQSSTTSELIETARQVNHSMIDYVIDELDQRVDGLAGRQIAVLGVAYKGDVDDARRSPGLDLSQKLQQRTDGRIDVRLHDPHVVDQVLDLQPLERALDGADATVIVTDHSDFAELRPTEVAEQMAGTLVFDTRAMLDAPKWESAGLEIVRI
ncbi:nucleotide sugar dehydrogenase [Halorussus salilacus]|uniref:nucleotide sugar dehydrogenase n=1 Tax=Halorussus salilacus TaxID=2953750 RepID=UPI00209E7C33|nr:nucleotide sugar dehydrogenase [Halorussus salilacus]USZ67395.1 nucleotide sugar dehydrogenase [Halorussus salilacus]